MLISVIVPVFNVERYIAKCIESILNQNYRNIELILVNDGSTDRSGEICDAYKEKDNRIKVIHKSNGGQSGARNLGIEMATGEYIVFLDSDDFWLDDKLEGMVKKLKNDNPDMLMFKAYSYYSDSDSYEPFSKEYNHLCFKGNGREVLANILKEDYDFGWCPIWYLIKREILIEQNLKFLEGYLCEDVNYVFELWNIVKSVVYYDEYVYAYRRDNLNSTTHIASFKFCKNLLDILEINLALLKKYNINGELKNLLFLNMQTLVSVVLFWFNKYDAKEKHVLKEKIENLMEIYIIDEEYKTLIRKKEKIVLFTVKILGIKCTAFIWSLKRKLVN